MSDLEKTRLCAQAMGLEYVDHSEHSYSWLLLVDPPATKYDPFHDDAQAMALVKRLRLHPVYDAEGRVWHCVTMQHGFYGRDSDLSRAIVECVAQMQAAKQPA